MNGVALSGEEKEEYPNSREVYFNSVANTHSGVKLKSTLPVHASRYHPYQRQSNQKVTNISNTSPIVNPKMWYEWVLMGQNGMNSNSCDASNYPCDPSIPATQMKIGVDQQPSDPNLLAPMIDKNFASNPQLLQQLMYQQQSHPLSHQSNPHHGCNGGQSFQGVTQQSALGLNQLDLMGLHASQNAHLPMDATQLALKQSTMLQQHPAGIPQPGVNVLPHQTEGNSAIVFPLAQNVMAPGMLSNLLGPNIKIPNQLDLIPSKGLTPPPGQKIDTSDHYHIFVGDLAPEIDAEKLKETFSVFGFVTECKIIKDMHTHKPKGYGFVAYANRLEADTAKNCMNGKMLGSRTIRTNWAVRKPPQPPGREQKPLNYEEVSSASSALNTTIYIGAVPKGLEEDVLKEFFKDFGTIQEVRIFKEKGYAFIRFDSHEAATDSIIKMHGKSLCGAPCKVSWGKETGEDKDIIQQIPPSSIFNSLNTALPTLAPSLTDVLRPNCTNLMPQSATMQLPSRENLLGSYAAPAATITKGPISATTAFTLPTLMQNGQAMETPILPLTGLASLPHDKPGYHLT